MYASTSDDMTRPARTSGGATGLRLGALLSEQAEAVALVREKWAESARFVPEAPDDDGAPLVSGLTPLADVRRELWFSSEGIREMWFARYVQWVGWWVETAQLALESTAGEPDVGLSKVLALRPGPEFRRAGNGRIDPLWTISRAPLRYWGENWTNYSLPRLIERTDLDRLLAPSGDAESAHAVKLAHRSVLTAQQAGDLAIELEESDSVPISDVDRNWNLYSTRHDLVCEYARAIANHLA